MTTREKRNQRKINELGRFAKCEICGEKEIEMLIKSKRSILEKHHIAGNNEGETITVCRNCHAKLTDDQLEWPFDIFDNTRTPEMKAIGFFFGLADILYFLAMLCRKFANIIYDFVIRIQGVDHT